MLRKDFVFLAAGNCYSSGVSLLVGYGLNVDVNLIFACDGGRLVVADVAMKSFMFQVVTVYAPSCVVERRSYQLLISHGS